MALDWLDDLRTGVRGGLADALPELSGPELAALAVELEQVRRQLAAVDVQVIAEMESRRLAGEFACSGTADLLVAQLRVSPAEAKARVRQAGDLAPRRSLTGEPLPPLLPTTASALAGGAISAAHVTVITDCLQAVPSQLGIEVIELAENALVRAAEHEHPVALRRTAATLLAHLDPDGLEPREDEVKRRRVLTLARNRDGSGRLTGRLTAEATAAWDAILDALSAPLCEDGAGEPDHRSAAQRRHDALAEAGERLLRSGSLPPSGGIPVTILARTTLAELEAGVGLALTGRGDLMSVRDLAGMSSDAEIVPVVFDTAGAVLALGRTRRLASRAQRLALAARDGGCCFPGCSRPAPWTEVHHVIPWQDGGATDLDNLCLLCRFHHREFEPRGWQVNVVGGLPEWTPPYWLDRRREPRRNTAHHSPEFMFDLGRACGHVPAA